MTALASDPDLYERESPGSDRPNGHRGERTTADPIPRGEPFGTDRVQQRPGESRPTVPFPSDAGQNRSKGCRSSGTCRSRLTSPGWRARWRMAERSSSCSYRETTFVNQKPHHSPAESARRWGRAVRVPSPFSVEEIQSVAGIVNVVYADVIHVNQPEQSPGSGRITSAV